MSVCLRHNVTLCALVLDGNSDISQEAERRITEELETRSMMPEVNSTMENCPVCLWLWRDLWVRVEFLGAMPLCLYVL